LANTLPICHVSKGTKRFNVDDSFATHWMANEKADAKEKSEERKYIMEQSKYNKKNYVFDLDK
jgi:hypothetical protein